MYESLVIDNADINYLREQGVQMHRDLLLFLHVPV